MTSNGSIRTRPPASRAFAAVSSALCTHTYVFHVAIAGAASGIEPTAATSPLRMRAMRYFAPDDGGMTSSSSQPKSSP